jgi:hypothetical protein
MLPPAASSSDTAQRNFCDHKVLVFQSRGIACVVYLAVCVIGTAGLPADSPAVPQPSLYSYVCLNVSILRSPCHSSTS